MPGSVSDNDLNAYYSIADVFLCMSEHEGFCVPLVESMYFNVPIIANNSTAIPYTLGDAGILVNNKNYREIAELIDVITNDNSLKMKLIKKQKNRLETLTYEKTKEKFRQIINNLTDEAQ
jgi:glycosyltransferase involved in cell wall biosynthesis